MDHARALTVLSIAHAVALRLRDAGAADELIAAALAIPIESVRTLTAVAEAKLTAICAEENSAQDDLADV